MKPADKERWSSFLKRSATVLLVLAVIGTWFWQSRLRARELRDLPSQERRAFYERTLETLRTACSHPPGPELKEYCREQADLAVRFPECDEACREIARQFQPQATK